jgi:serine/threonine protein kinase
MGTPHSGQKTRKCSNEYVPWDGDVQVLLPLGNGVSGMTWAIDKERVAKVHIGSAKSRQDIETEREAYRILGRSHPHVLRCFETDNPSGLVLARCQQSVRQRLQLMMNQRTWPQDIVIRWMYQAAKGLAYIHRCGIIHGDGECHACSFTNLSINI